MPQVIGPWQLKEGSTAAEWQSMSQTAGGAVFAQLIPALLWQEPGPHLTVQDPAPHVIGPWQV